MAADRLLLLGCIAALPWCLAAPFFLLRMRGSDSLSSLDPADVAAQSERTASRVSIVLPARNEAAHITACVRGIRACTWRNVELIVVDDHSTDGTGSLARDAAGGDARVRVLDAPPLPDGWFGKQWACHTGASAATGDLLLFTDADTRHAPELVTRMVMMRERRGAELLSVGGRQEMETFWERAVQPLMFALILSRYGGTGQIERARQASDVLANGQCFMLSRAAYDRAGGHERVRQFVAEDLMMAQSLWRSGARVSLAFGIDQLSTRMYDGLSSLVSGWSKNVYAGGRHAMRGGRAGRALFPFLLLAPPLLTLAPVMCLCIVALRMLVGASDEGWDRAALVWSTLATAGVLAGAAILNRSNGDPWYRAGYAIPGAAVQLYIFIRAITGGNAVRWKDRAYVSH